MSTWWRARGVGSGVIAVWVSTVGPPIVEARERRSPWLPGPRARRAAQRPPGDTQMGGGDAPGRDGTGFFPPPTFGVGMSAVTYSPTPYRVQYHRRWRA